MENHCLNSKMKELKELKELKIKGIKLKL